MNKVTQHIEKHFILCHTINNLWQHNGNKKSDRPNLPDNVSTTDILCEITHTNLFKIDFLETSGNDPTPLKTFDIKGFYSSRLATDSKMAAKNQDALLFTADHLLILGTKLIVPLAENCRDDKSPYLIQPVNIC